MGKIVLAIVSLIAAITIMNVGIKKMRVDCIP